jgi:hypothetical protein
LSRAKLLLALTDHQQPISNRDPIFEIKSRRTTSPPLSSSNFYAILKGTIHGTSLKKRGPACHSTEKKFIFAKKYIDPKGKNLLTD